MGNNGGKYNVNKIKVLIWEEKPTKKKKNNGRNGSHHKIRENKIGKYNTQLVSITD